MRHSLTTWDWSATIRFENDPANFTIFDLDQPLGFSDGYNALCAELVIKTGIVDNQYRKATD